MFRVLVHGSSAQCSPPGPCPVDPDWYLWAPSVRPHNAERVRVFWTMGLFDALPAREMDSWCGKVHLQYMMGKALGDC